MQGVYVYIHVVHERAVRRAKVRDVPAASVVAELGVAARRIGVLQDDAAGDALPANVIAIRPSARTMIVCLKFIKKKSVCP